MNDSQGVVVAQTGGTALVAQPALNASGTGNAPVDYKTAVLEAQVALNDAAYSRFEIEVAFLSLLLTVLIIFFAVRTKDAAVQEVTKGLSEERKRIREIIQETEAAQATALADINTKLQGLTQTVQHAVAMEMERLAHISATMSEAEQRVEAYRTGALAYISQQVVSGVSLTVPQERVLNVATKSAQRKDTSELTIDDYHALIGTASQDADWIAVSKHIKKLVSTFPDSSMAQCSSLFYTAVSASLQKSFPEAIKNYRKLIDHFAFDQDPDIIRQVARSKFNLARCLSKNRAPIEAMGQYDALIEQYSDCEDSELRILASNGALNRAILFSQMNNHYAAIEAYRAIILNFRASTDERDRALVDDAHYNVACAYARLPNLEKTKSALLVWKSRGQILDPDEILDDEAFVCLSADENFCAFLKDNAGSL